MRSKNCRKRKKITHLPIFTDLDAVLSAAATSPGKIKTKKGTTSLLSMNVSHEWHIWLLLQVSCVFIYLQLIENHLWKIGSCISCFIQTCWEIYDYFSLARSNSSNFLNGRLFVNICRKWFFVGFVVFKSDWLIACANWGNRVFLTWI